MQRQRYIIKFYKQKIHSFIGDDLAHSSCKFIQSEGSAVGVQAGSLSASVVLYIEVFLSNRYLFHWWNFLNFNAYIRSGPRTDVCPFVIWCVFYAGPVLFSHQTLSHSPFARPPRIRHQRCVVALLSFFCIYFRGTCTHTCSRNRTQTTPRRRFFSTPLRSSPFRYIYS